MILALLGACAGGVENAADELGLTLLSPREQLVRLSVDLRGVHPTEDELRQVEADPGAYEDFATAWVDDPRFMERLREVWDLRVLTRTGDPYHDVSEAGLDAGRSAAVADSIGDEPLRLLSYVAERDLPYTWWVTADHTVADEDLAAMWDLAYPDGATGWQVAHYRDGRPMAGVLSMTTLWERYPSMGGNANRHRANALSRMLLCEDYLERPIRIDREAADQLTDDPENAIATNPACQSCHSTLDPLAGNLFGFFHHTDGRLEDSRTYRPEAESGWREHSGKEPAYYGTPTPTLTDLGEAIARDPRYVDCAVLTAFEGFMQRSPTDEDWELVQAARATFTEHDLRLDALVWSLVTSPWYRAAGAEDPEVDARVPGVRVASPRQLASIVEDVTGYRWNFEGRDIVSTHDHGLPLLAGWVDGVTVQRTDHVPTLGTALVQERLAEAAAWYVAVHDLNGLDQPILLAGIDRDTRPGDEAFSDKARDLHLRITGLPMEDEAAETEALGELWQAVHVGEGSTTKAWAAVIAALLRDPRVLFY